jgi:hypothetical protein
MGGSPADLLTNQAVLNPKVHSHTSRAQPVEIKPATPKSQAVALPTTPRIPYVVLYIFFSPLSDDSTAKQNSECIRKATRLKCLGFLYIYDLAAQKENLILKAGKSNLHLNHAILKHLLCWAQISKILLHLINGHKIYIHEIKAMHVYACCQYIKRSIIMFVLTAIIGQKYDGLKCRHVVGALQMPTPTSCLCFRQYKVDPTGSLANSGWLSRHLAGEHCRRRRRTQ